MSATLIGDQLERSWDRGVFNVQLEADTQGPPPERVLLTIPTGTTRTPDSMGWMNPHAEVKVAVLEVTALVGEINARSST